MHRMNPRHERGVGGTDGDRARGGTKEESRGPTHRVATVHGPIVFRGSDVPEGLAVEVYEAETEHRKRALCRMAKDGNQFYFAYCDAEGPIRRYAACSCGRRYHEKDWIRHAVCGWFAWCRRPVCAAAGVAIRIEDPELCPVMCNRVAIADRRSDLYAFIEKHAGGKRSSGMPRIRKMRPYRQMRCAFSSDMPRLEDGSTEGRRVASGEMGAER